MTGNRYLRSRQLNLQSLEARDVPAAAVASPEYLPDRIIVRTTDGQVPESPLMKSVESLGNGLYAVNLLADVGVTRGIRHFQLQSGVVYAEPDYVVHADLTPNDPSYGTLWGMNNTGQSGGTVDADVDAPEAWDVSTGSGAITVGVIDTGIDYRHVDLYKNVWINQAEIPTTVRSNLTDIDSDGRITFYDLNNAANQGAGKITDLNANGIIDGGDILTASASGGWSDGVNAGENTFTDDLVGWNFVNNTNNPLDDHNHGTHVSGTIGAMGNNSVGVVGVNWRVQFAGLKFLNASGSGSTSGAISSVNYATATGFKITNNSWGGGGFSQALSDAITVAQNAGSIFVAAAGNAGANNDTTPNYPSNYPQANVVAIGASTRTDARASFSSYGATTVDLFAPGASILSTTRNNTYSTFDGTSMATPMVAGAMALVWDNHPTWTYQQVIEAIEVTVDVKPAFQGISVTGGRLNVNNAIRHSFAATVANVTSTAANGSYGLSATIPISVGFTNPVTVTGTPLLALNAGGGATASYVSGSGTATLTFNYTVAVGQSSADLDYTSAAALTLNGGTIKDTATTQDAVLTLPAPGAAGSLGANKNIAIDSSPAAVSNVTSTAANGTYWLTATIPITIAFTKAVTVTGTPQLALNAGGSAIATYASGSGTTTLTFSYTVGSGHASADLDYTSTGALTLAGGTIVEQPSGQNAVLTLPAPAAAGSLGANKNIVIDTVPPLVSNVTSSNANGTYLFGAAIQVTVAFDKIVVVTGVPQLALDSGGTANYSSGSGTATLTFDYTVGLSQTSADLDYISAAALSLNGGTITEQSSGQNATLTLPAPGAAGSLGANKNIVIDTSPPVVSNVTSPTANGTYLFGATIQVTVAFNRVVAVTGTPQIALNSGGTASYASGSGTATLTFDYTVGLSQTSADLDYTSTAALTLNGGTITEQSSGQNATLTLPAPGAAGSLGVNKNIVIDTSPPVVSNITSPTANGTYLFGAAIQITVAFNRVLAVTGVPQLALNSGGTANYSSGSGTATLTFDYTVGLGQTSADLDYTSTAALTLTGGTITEQSSGQNATLTLPAPGAAGSLGANKNIVIDTSPPVVSNVTSPTANGTYLFGATIQVTVAFNRVVAVTGTPQIALNSGGTANYSSGSGTATLTFTYVVGTDDASADLDYTSTSAINVNGGSIAEQSSGQNATLTLPAPGAAGSIGASKNLIIDGSAANVTNVTSPNPNGTYLHAAALSVAVSFKRVVVVTGTPRIALNSGGTATYASGSGTSTLTFNYLVGAGQQSADLDYAAVNALSLNGGTIIDQATGQDATLALSAPGAAGSLGDNKNIVINARGPVVVEYRVLFGKKKFNILGSSRFDLPWRITGIQIVFDGPITAGNINSLTGITSTKFTGRGTNTLTWTFAPISIGSFATTLADSGPNVVRDAIGNPIAPFSQTVRVLYGDFTGDGIVDAADEAGVRSNLTAPYKLNPSSYNIFADLSGDGLVNLVDVGISRTRRGSSLP